jgi:hypothetical protein
MCHFAIVEISSESPELPDGLRFEPNRYPELGPAQVGAKLVAVTDGHCSCGIYRSGRRPKEQLRAKYQKRGWSHAKIERALRDHDTARPSEQVPAQFERWLGDASRLLGEVRLFVHWDEASLGEKARLASQMIDSKALLAGAALPSERWVVIRTAA